MEKKLDQKPKSFLLRVLLVIAALCLVIVVIIQMVLLVAINALNTGKAHDYIQSQVTSVLSASGYNATFDKLIYDPVRGFTLSDVAVLDKDGTIATVDKFSLDIAFSKIVFKQLDMVASAGTVHLIRSPESQAEQLEDNAGTVLQPFVLPDIYFKKIKISPFSISHLNIDPSIAGLALSFSPILKAEVSLKDQLKINLSLTSKPDHKIADISLPEKLELAGSFTPSSLSFVLDKFSVLSSDYNLSGKGQGQLTDSGTIDVKIDGQYPDLKRLTQDNIESASLSLIIADNYKTPSVNMTVNLQPASLKDKGLSPINMTATMKMADNLAANIVLDTKYKEEPISLKSEMSYKDNILAITSLTGTAPEIAVDGAGNLSATNNMFDGKITISASDLSYYKDLLSLDIAGNVKTDVILSARNDRQFADVRASINQFKFDTTVLDKANAELHFNDVQSIWPQTGQITLAGLNVGDGVSLDNASAIIKDLGHEAYALAINGKAYVPSAVSFKGDVNLSNMTNEFPTFSNIDVKAMLGKSVVALTGAIDPQNVDLKIVTKDFRGSDIPAAVSDALSNIRLNGDIAMTGPSAAPITKAHVSITGLNTGAYKNLNITADASHQDNQVSVSVLGKGAGIKNLTADTSFPLTLALWPFAFNLDMSSPLTGRLVGDLDLGAISTLFLPPTQKFSANLKADGVISGTLGDPDAKGTAVLRNGQFIDDQNGIELKAININSSFTNKSVTLQSITMTDGEKGTMKGSGQVGFTNDQITNLSIAMKKFHLPKSNLANGMMDATFSLKNAESGYALNGAVDVESMNIIVPETFQSKIPELNIVDRRTANTNTAPSQIISLNVKVNAPNQIFVRGWGLDAEFGGAVDVSGDVTSPLFDGTLSSKRGRYEEFGKRFTLSRANLRFQGELPPSPYLDILATTPANDVTASIALAGPVTKPAISFSSTPALPQDEVLSRLLFGQDTAKITPFQAIQLAQTLRRFSGEGGDGGLDPLGMIRSLTGLDDISIDTDANGETNVGVGKYLTDKVYLEFEKGKAANSGGANIQIEVTPSINVQSEIGQDAQAGGGVFWKHDY